jgi:hypothetical protein
MKNLKKKLIEKTFCYKHNLKFSSKNYKLPKKRRRNKHCLELSSSHTFEFIYGKNHAMNQTFQRFGKKLILFCSF